MSAADHDLARELIAAVALGAATPEEVSRVERHAATCVVCSEELDSLRQTAAQLALAAPRHAPPPDLKKRVMREVARDRESRREPSRRGGFALLRPWPALSGVLAACVIALLGWNLSLRSGDSAGTRVLPIEASVGQGGQVSLVSSTDRVVAVVRLAGLPDQGAGKGWALWRIPQGAAPISAGFLERQPDGSYIGTVDVTDAKALTLGVTPESLENRSAPTVAPVAAVALPA